MGNTLIEMFSFLIFYIKFLFCKKQRELIQGPIAFSYFMIWKLTPPNKTMFYTNIKQEHEQIFMSNAK